MCAAMERARAATGENSTLQLSTGTSALPSLPLLLRAVLDCPVACRHAGARTACLTADSPADAEVQHIHDALRRLVRVCMCRAADRARASRRLPAVVSTRRHMTTWLPFGTTFGRGSAGPRRTRGTWCGTERRVYSMHTGRCATCCRCRRRSTAWVSTHDMWTQLMPPQLLARAALL